VYIKIKQKLINEKEYEKGRFRTGRQQIFKEQKNKLEKFFIRNTH